MRISILALLLFNFLAGCGGGDRPINKDLDMPKASTKDKADVTAKS